MCQCVGGGGGGGASRPALPTGATITTSHWHSSSRCVALLQSATEVRTPMHILMPLTHHSPSFTRPSPVSLLKDPAL